MKLFNCIRNLFGGMKKALLNWLTSMFKGKTVGDVAKDLVSVAEDISGTAKKGIAKSKKVTVLNAIEFYVPQKAKDLYAKAKEQGCRCKQQLQMFKGWDTLMTNISCMPIPI